MYIKDPSPMAPANTPQLCNVAKRVGLRQLVKSRQLSPQDALKYLLEQDKDPNPSIVAWLRKKCKGEL